MSAGAVHDGCVQVYTGDGKGKTSAAVGLAVRAAAAGLHVFIGQFFKGGESSEMRLLRRRVPEMTIESFGTGRFVRGVPRPEEMAAAERGLQRLRDVLVGGEFDVVIADEANSAVDARLLSIEGVLGLLDLRPARVELVFTGRNADARLVARADLVTEMRKVCHPFDDGVPARAGIEY